MSGVCKGCYKYARQSLPCGRDLNHGGPCGPAEPVAAPGGPAVPFESVFPPGSIQLMCVGTWGLDGARFPCGLGPANHPGPCGPMPPGGPPAPFQGMSAPEQCPARMGGLECGLSENHAPPCVPREQKTPRTISSGDLRECQHDPPCCSDNCSACVLCKLDALHKATREAVEKLVWVETGGIADDVALFKVMKLLRDAVRRSRL